MVIKFLLCFGNPHADTLVITYYLAFHIYTGVGTGWLFPHPPSGLSNFIHEIQHPSHQSTIFTVASCCWNWWSKWSLDISLREKVIITLIVKYPRKCRNRKEQYPQLQKQWGENHAGNNYLYSRGKLGQWNNMANQVLFAALLRYVFLICTKGALRRSITYDNQ